MRQNISEIIIAGPSADTIILVIVVTVIVLALLIFIFGSYGRSINKAR
jgi:hypothetical protein